LPKELLIPPTFFDRLSICAAVSASFRSVSSLDRLIRSSVSAFDRLIRSSVSAFVRLICAAFSMIAAQTFSKLRVFPHSAASSAVITAIVNLLFLNLAFKKPSVFNRVFNRE
jgi:hypothetical protein